MRRLAPVRYTIAALVLLIGGAVLPTTLLAGSTQTAHANASVQPTISQLGLTSWDLIADALDTGKINLGTSWLYRTYALDGDPRLPNEFAGTGEVIADHALFFEAQRLRPSPPAAIGTQLDPYLVRPTNPISVFNAQATPEPDAANEAGAGETLDCNDGWTSQASTVHPNSIRVWAACTGDYEADIAEALAFCDVMWELETAFLGPPIPDEGTEEAGGDPAIDFYLVSRGETAPRPGPGAPGEIALASAHPTPPFEGKTTSSYVLAWREDVGTLDFRSTLVHEFFHVLQAAHNRESAFGYTALPLDDNYDTFYEGENWWVESSAVWAETYFGRQIPGLGPAVARTHGRFVNNFQPVDEALHRPSYGGREGGLHMYAAYIWWLFMEQEVGAEAVAEIWDGLEAIPADDVSQGTDVIDAQLPFAQHFRDFAVRNLNLALEPGNPISPRYQDLDPNFPDNIPPVFKAGDGPEKTLQAHDEGDDPRRFDDTIKSLSADYYHFEPDPKAQQVTFDFSRLTPTTALDVDAIVKVKDKGWERRQLDPTTPTTWCRTNPNDNVEAFYLVLSNHEKNILTTIKGDFTIAAQKSAC